MKVLLLDAHTVQSLSVARSLKDIGYEVHGFIESKVSYGFVSRYIDYKIICPSLLKESEKYLSFLLDYILYNNIDIIIPLYNDSAEFLSLNKEYIEDNFSVKCAIPSYNTFIKAHDKEKLMLFCEKYGIPHPKTSYISLDNLDSVAKYVGFPALIKPNLSSGSRGIKLVNSLFDVKQELPNIESEFGRSTLQEYIDNSGSYYNVMIYRDRYRKFHESVVLKIMRYFPLKGGTSCYCETINNDFLVEICQKTLNVMDWVGFADFDIMESKSGEYKIIEVNPRVPASIHAAYISGINFPEMMIKDLLKENIPIYNNNVGKSMRFFGLDVLWFIFSSNRFKFKPSWFRLFESRVYYQDGSIYDPIPMVVGILQGVIKYLNPSYRKSKLNK